MKLMQLNKLSHIYYIQTKVIRKKNLHKKADGVNTFDDNSK